LAVKGLVSSMAGLLFRFRLCGAYHSVRERPHEAFLIFVPLLASVRSAITNQAMRTMRLQNPWIHPEEIEHAGFILQSRV
jgi:hypothetical protein